MEFLNEKYEHLRAHNAVYNDRLQQLLKTNHYCAIIQATGTGKSYQAFQVIHDMCLDKWTGSNTIDILVVAPTQVLVTDWDSHLRSGGDFEKSLKRSDLLEGFTRTGMASFNLVGGNKINYKYSICTYDGLISVAGVSGKEASEKDFTLSQSHLNKIESFINSFNLIIFDEVHHIGATTYAPVIKNVLEHANSKRYILGMTATDQRTDGNSVANYFGGSLVRGVTMSQAQDGTYDAYAPDGSISSVGNEKILPKIKLVYSVVFDKRLFACRALKDMYINWVNNVPNKVERESLLFLVKNIFNNLSVEAYAKFARKQLNSAKPQRLICFYQAGENVDNVRTFVREVFGIDKIVDLRTGTSTKEDENTLEEFRNSKEDIIIIAIDKLNEGLHVPGVTGIIMVRKTFSSVTYIQQIGRAMSYDSRNLTIPVFDVVGNAAIRADIEDGEPDEFEKFISNINGTQSLAPNFEEAVKMLKNLEDRLKLLGLKKPKIAAVADLKNVLQSLFPLIVPKLSRFSNFDLKELKDAYNEIFINKKKHDTSYAYDISMFDDTAFRRAMLYKGKKSSGVDYPLLYYILQAYTEKRGRFIRKSTLLDFCLNNLQYRIGGERQSLEKELENIYYSSFYISESNGHIRMADLYLEGYSIERILNI